MDLEDVLKEYLYHCMARNFTPKTMINKRQEYKHLLRFLKEKRGITHLENITEHDLKSYIRGKQQEGLKPVSIVAKIKLVKSFFNWCVKEEGYLEESPMDKIEIPKVPKKVITGFTNKEVTAMIDSFTFKTYLEARNKSIIAMLSDLGIRSKELLTLRHEDFREGALLINGKGNKERIVFVSPVLKKILIKYERIKKEYFKDKIVKSNNYFLSYQGDQMSHVGLYNVVTEAGRRAGVTNKRCSPHNFRHYYSIASLNSSGNLGIYDLSKLLGHSEISTTTRYLASMDNQQLLDKAVASSPLMNLRK